MIRVRQLKSNMTELQMGLERNFTTILFSYENPCCSTYPWKGILSNRKILECYNKQTH